MAITGTCPTSLPAILAAMLAAILPRHLIKLVNRVEGLMDGRIVNYVLTQCRWEKS